MPQYHPHTKRAIGAGPTPTPFLRPRDDTADVYDPIAISGSQVAFGDMNDVATALGVSIDEVDVPWSYADQETDCFDLVLADDNSTLTCNDEAGNAPISLDGSLEPLATSTFSEPTATATASTEPTDTVTPTPTPVPTDGPIQCNGLDSKKYINVDDLNSLFSGFCNDLRSQGSQDPGSGSFQRSYYIKTPEEISLSIDWAPGTTIDMDACETHMKALSDDCDGNDPTNNPMNWKGGGHQDVAVGGTATYRITPIALRQPHPLEPLGHVECSGLKFWLSGTGWANKDTGDNLKTQFNGCSGSSYGFNYGLGDDGREWTMTGWLGPGQGNCMHNAIITAGGPDLWC